MANLGDLAAKIQKLRKVIPLKANAIKLKVVENIVTDFAIVTPVDTSHAVSNWQVSAGAPITSEREAYSLGSKGSTAGASRASVLTSMHRTLRLAKPKEPVFITNNVEYIHDIDRGQGQNPTFSGGFGRRADIIAEKTISAHTIVRR